MAGGGGVGFVEVLWEDSSGGGGRIVVVDVVVTWVYWKGKSGGG